MDAEADNVLTASDVVIYGSSVEEQSFPDILIKALCLEKPIIAPDLSIIRKYVCFYFLLFETQMSNAHRLE